VRVDVMKTGAQFEAMKTRKDGSIKLEFETRELDGNSIAAMMNLRGRGGWLFFCPSDMESIEIPADAPPEIGQKTPSQRLRAVLFVLWQQTKPEGQDFESFYRSIMDMIIEHYKRKLD